MNPYQIVTADDLTTATATFPTGRPMPALEPDARHALRIAAGIIEMEARTDG